MIPLQRGKPGSQLPSTVRQERDSNLDSPIRSPGTARFSPPHTLLELTLSTLCPHLLGTSPLHVNNYIWTELKRMRVCSPVVRKIPGDKRELQIQVLALSDLKLTSIKYSLEESKMAQYNLAVREPLQIRARTQTWGCASQGSCLTTGRSISSHTWSRSGRKAEALSQFWGSCLFWGLNSKRKPIGGLTSNWCARIIMWTKVQARPFPSAPWCRPPHRLSSTRVWGSWAADIQSRTCFLCSHNSPTT